MRSVVYIAGPYRGESIHDTIRNIRTAEMFALKYWKKGYVVICPHKNTALLDGECPDAVWLDGALELLRRSDIVVLIPGWKQSEGALVEKKEAEGLRKIIIDDEEPEE